MEGRYHGMDYRRKPSAGAGTDSAQGFPAAEKGRVAYETPQYEEVSGPGMEQTAVFKAPAEEAVRSAAELRAERFRVPPRVTNSERVLYRPRSINTILVDELGHPTHQRVAVGRNGKVQYSPQARALVQMERGADAAPAQEQAAQPEPGREVGNPYEEYAATGDFNASGAYQVPDDIDRADYPQTAVGPDYGTADGSGAEAYAGQADSPDEDLDEAILHWEAEREAERPAEKDEGEERRGLLEKKVSRIVLGILAASFVVVTALMLLLPRSTKSLIEKRELATMPPFSLQAYFSGEYTAAVANFFDDTVPMRDSLKNIGNNVKAVFGLPKSDDSVEFVGVVNKVGAQAGPAPVVSTPETPAVSDLEGSSSVSVDPEAVNSSIGAGADLLAGAAGRRMEGAAIDPNKFVNQEAEGNVTENGLIVVKQEGHFRALELFGGGSGDNYAENLNNLYDQVGGYVSIWSMPAPLACEFYLPSNFQEYSTSQSDCFDKVAAKLNPGIHSINMCGALAKHVDEPIYCRTDHHWQPLGAYYAAQAFAEAAGVPFNDLDTYTPGKIEGFVGSMYSYTGSSDILNDPEDFVYYTPGVEYTSSYYDTGFNFLWGDDDLFAEGAGGSDAYMYYLGGDSYIVKTDTQVQNGRKLLIVKDSYGNATVPFFTGSFEQIYVADMRYLERNLVSFINDMGITDVLFTMSSYSLVGDQAANIANLLTQNAGETVTDDQLSQDAGE